MAFPWVAAAGAVIGAGSSIFGGIGANNAAKAKNRAAERAYDRQRDRSIGESRAALEMAELDYAWNTAQHEALIFNEKQSIADQEFVNDRMISAATKGLELNEQAIFDQYSTGEDLRARQEGMTFKHNQDMIGLEATEAARQYMTQIQQNALSAKLQTQAQKKEVDTLLGNMTLKAQEEGLLRDISFVESMSRQGSATARGMERTGGTSSARAQTMNLAKELGRSYGQIALARQGRDMNLSTLNATMQGEYATQLGRYALDSRQALYSMGSANQKFNLESQLGINKFRDLTMPGFELASRQGERDLSALHIRTQQQLDQASMPIRESVKFAPQKALPGFMPLFSAPTKVQGPSTASMIGGAITAGVKGAMSASYTKADGSLGFY